MNFSDDECRILQFGHITVNVYPSGTRIVFPDGCEVPGEPHDTDEYRGTAQRYGYGSDTLSLCIEHEIMHVALCHWLGLPESPTMAAVKVGSDDNLELRGLEEAAVLAIQQFARACHIDLVQRFS